MTRNNTRTPVVQAILGTLGILVQPALAGWILRALGMLLLALLPFAAISTYSSVPAASRLAFAAAIAVAALAGGSLYFLGTRLRRRR